MATMGNWGQGPWFDPETPETPETPDTPDVPESLASHVPPDPPDSQGQPPIQRRSGGPVQRHPTGGPVQVPVPGPAARRGEPSRPLTQSDTSGNLGQVGQWDSSQGSAEAFSPPASLAFPASANETSSGPDSSGNHWTPPWRQIPVQSGATPSDPGSGTDALLSQPSAPSYVPPAPMLPAPPLPRPLTPPPLDAVYSSLPPLSPRRGSRGGDRRDGHRPSRTALLPIILGVVALLVICSLAFIFTNPLQTFGGQTAQQPTSSIPATNTDTTGTGTPASSPSPDASPTTTGISGTATPGPATTATPNPLPTSATVTFHPTTKQLTSADIMASCPSGCDIVGKAYTNAKTFDSVQWPATLIPQSALLGTITAYNFGISNWKVASYSFKGGGWSCAAQSIDLPPRMPTDYPCFIGVSSPSSLLAHTIEGTASTSPRVTYAQADPLLGNAYYKVTSSDCASAESDTEQKQGVPWAQSWWGSQTIPSGWVVALSQPKITYTELSCPLNMKQSTFIATITTHVDEAAFNPAAAQALAASRLDSLLPSGYLWKVGSRTTCTPTITSTTISPSAHSVLLRCADSDTAYYNWTSSLESALASKLADHSKTSALSTCNSAVGVQASTCSISIQGGDGTVLPASASAIVIQPSAP